MNSSALIDELRETLRSLRVLAPDRSLELLEPEAVQWVEDHIESAWVLAQQPAIARPDVAERVASLALSLREALWPELRGDAVPVWFGQSESGMPPPAVVRGPSRERPSVRCSRSAREVFDAWMTRAQRADATTVYDPLTQTRARIEQACPVRNTLAFALTALMEPLDETHPLVQGSVFYAHAAVECAIDHVLWRWLMDGPSPLEPWLALWQRGAWPVWTDEGEAHVLVATRSERGPLLDEPLPELRFASALPLCHRPLCAQTVVASWVASAVTYRSVDPEATAISVGRAQGNDLPLYDAMVARRHMEIVRRDGRWCARDLASTNGVLFRGRLLRTEQPLRGGECFLVGRGLLLFLGSER